MPGDWIETTLGNVLTLKRGYDLPEQDRVPGPHPIVSSSGITGRHRDAKVKGPGVVTGRYGTLGEVHYIAEDYWPLNTTLFVEDFHGNEPRFIAYFLKCLDFRAFSDKSSVPGLNRNHLHSAVVRFPRDLAEQRAIAAVLGALDDKIELNRRMCRTLEGIARAIFQAWFVDFLPVKAKAAGAKRFRGMPQAVFDSLPTAFVDSPLGPIPKGWRVGTLCDIAELSKDTIAPGDFPDELFDHFSIPAFDAGQIPVRESGDGIKSNKALLTAPSVLVSKLNPRFPRVWLVPAPGALRQVASTEFLVTVPREGFTREWLFCLAQTPSFQDDMESRVTGTSGSHQRVKPDDYLRIELVLPGRPLVEAFTRIVTPILRRVQVNRSACATLAALRDALLPKLVSGELRIRDVERIIGRCA